jgi:hypothetical protein
MGVGDRLVVGIGARDGLAVGVEVDDGLAVGIEVDDGLAVGMEAGDKLAVGIGVGEGGLLWQPVLNAPTVAAPISLRKLRRVMVLPGEPSASGWLLSSASRLSRVSISTSLTFVNNSRIRALGQSPTEAKVCPRW